MFTRYISLLDYVCIYVIILSLFIPVHCVCALQELNSNGRQTC